MMGIEDLSTDTLIKEIEKRGHEEEKIESMPAPLENPDFSSVIELCKNQILEMTKADYCEDNDSDHYIYEAAMQAIYGKDVWEWINKQIYEI